MTFRTISSGTWGLCLLSVLGFGCADIERNTEEPLAQDKAAVTAAPVRAELTDLAAIKAMKARPPQRAARGLLSAVTEVIPTGQAYKNVFALSPGQTITAETSNGTPSNTDTVLVLYQRSDNSPLFTMPYTNQTNIQTLQVNDDYTGLYSRVSYTNNTGTSPMNVFLMCFSYCSGSNYCREGSADLTLTYPGGSYTERQVDCATGIYPADNQGGHAYVRSTIDPVLFVFNRDTPAYDGFINDDCADASLLNPSNSNDPCVSGLTGNYTWKGLWNYGPSGSVTLYYP